jgi:hypothetical protein
LYSKGNNLLAAVVCCTQLDLAAAAKVSESFWTLGATTSNAAAAWQPSSMAVLAAWQQWLVQCSNKLEQQMITSQSTTWLHVLTVLDPHLLAAAAVHILGYVGSASQLARTPILPHDAASTVTQHLTSCCLNERMASVAAQRTAPSTSP